jgi:hypothetical protein
MLLNYKKLFLVIIALMSAGVIADKIHDPTKPQLKSAAKHVVNDAGIKEVEIQEPVMILQGIMNRKSARIAIISDQVYAKGDTINGYIISQVNNDNVVLVNSETQKRLYIYE